MAGTGSPSTVVSIEMHLRRLRKNMREPPVSNNLSSRSEDFFFFTSAQLDAQFRNTQCDVALVRSRAACKPRQADTFGRLNRKTHVLCLHRSVGQSKNVSFSRRFFEGPPTSPNECQVFRDIWWKPKPDHCPMLSARLSFWASCSLDMCPLMRFARPLPFIARSCRLSFAFWPGRLPKPFFLAIGFSQDEVSTKRVRKSGRCLSRGRACVSSMGKWCTPGVRHLETCTLLVLEFAPWRV